MATLNRTAFKAARLARGLTQERLAELLKVDPVTVQGWESGRRQAPQTLGKLFELCDVLGLSADVLLGRTPMPSARFIAAIHRAAGAVGPDYLVAILSKRLIEIEGVVKDVGTNDE